MSSVSVSVPETNTRFARSPVGRSAYSGARSSSDSLNVNSASLNSLAKTRRATSRVGALLISHRPRFDEDGFRVGRTVELFGVVREHVAPERRAGDVVVAPEHRR